MTKVWEPRVGKLLAPPYFYWTHKCPDTSKYGGAPRIDYQACDLYGRFWMVEVKQLSEDRKSINIERDLTAGQRSGLQDVLDADGSALLAIGQGKTLYVFTWGRIVWLREQGIYPLIPLEEASATFHWKGPRSWANTENVRKFHRVPLISPTMRLSESGYVGPGTPRTPTTLTGAYSNTDASPSILKPGDSTPTGDNAASPVRSVRSSSTRGSRATSSARSRTGGGMS